MDIPWDDARLFLAIAEKGSLSAAANVLRVAQPTVSRRLVELESRLGETVFARSVEGTRLTAFGERLLAPARRMAEAAAELEREAEKRETSVEGVVRITAPPGVAADFVAPFAASLRTRLPGIRLELVSAVRYLDLARREADLALRMQAPSQRDLVEVARSEFPALAYASRAYAEHLGPRPSASAVDWIAWAPPFEDVEPNRTLARLLPGFRPVFAADDFLVQFHAAEAGLGAIFLGDFRHRFARATPLVPLDLQGIPHVKSGLHLVAAKSALEVPRVRKVADLLAEELRYPERAAHPPARSKAPAKKRR